MADQPQVLDEMPWEIHVQWRGRGVVVRLAGIIDTNAAGPLGAVLEELVALQPEVIVLDLESLQGIASAGLGAIVKTHNACRRRAARMHLARVSEPVGEVLRVTYLSKLLAVFDSVDQALATT